MFDFSNVSDKDLAEVWELVRHDGPPSPTGIRRAIMVELDARIHALTPSYFTVNLGGSK